MMTKPYLLEALRDFAKAASHLSACWQQAQTEAQTNREVYPDGVHPLDRLLTTTMPVDAIAMSFDEFAAEVWAWEERVAEDEPELTDRVLGCGHARPLEAGMVVYVGHYRGFGVVYGPANRGAGRLVAEATGGSRFTRWDDPNPWVVVTLNDGTTIVTAVDDLQCQGCGAIAQGVAVDR